MDGEITLIQTTQEEDASLKTFKVKNDPESKRLLLKRAHDVSNAVRTLRFLHESLQAGYKFDDSVAQDKILYIGKSLDALEKELPLIRELLIPS